MRALLLTCGLFGWSIVASTAWGEIASSPAGDQVAGCPTILPVAEGERSIVVPTQAPQFASAPSPVPHIASRPATATSNASLALLRQKLVERDRLQREISELRAATNTPERIRVRVKFLEIDRTKMRKLGVDFASVSGDGDPSVQNVIALLRGVSNSSPGVTPWADNGFNRANVDNGVLDFFDALEKHGLLRVIANPTVMTVNGQETSLHTGASLALKRPMAGPAGASEFGTSLKVKATMLGNDTVRLSINSRLCEPDIDHPIEIDGQKLPTCRIRGVDTAADVVIGQSFVLSGLVQKRVVAQPGLSLGKTAETHETALVVVATPELVR